MLLIIIIIIIFGWESTCSWVWKHQKIVIIIFLKIFIETNFGQKNKNSYLTYLKVFLFQNFKTWLKLFLKIFYERLNMAVLG